jgi:hypothetical protein
MNSLAGVFTAKEESFDERNRSATPETDRSVRDGDKGGGDMDADEGSSDAAVRWLLFLLLPPFGPLFDPPLSPAELPFRTCREVGTTINF